MDVLIVESPAKAKTINKYLNNKFQVVASFGHIRDLPAKNGSIDPNNDFSMQYEIIKNSEKHVKNLEKAVSKANKLYLATDPDREGEAIAWHIVEAMKERKALKKNVEINRVVFNEITKNAVTKAIDSPREINMDLVHAQQARRGLDYLVGFTLSPILWRKLPGSKSAGRVQSVALRLICEREDEINKFTSQEYWSIKAQLLNSNNDSFYTTLSHYGGQKLNKFDIPNSEKAQELAEMIKQQSYTVSNIENKQVKRNPYPPFITSTLQQDASSKLNFTAKNTMSIAQKLYEGIDIGGETVGLITYMRTDGFYMADEAINKIRDTIKVLFGDKYVPKTTRVYTKKIKNAQEAHEAIRPTDITRLPEDLKQYLSDDQFKLYDLIWKRSIACQMESAIIDQVAVDITSANNDIILHATGSTMRFDGFYKVYGNTEDDDNKGDTLPNLQVGDKCQVQDVLPKQHFTQPPPRYTEASLVKKMEEIGIGRPSTYANIISVLQDRDYVKLQQKKFVVSERGRVVTAFLHNFFSRYVEYDFTANLEEKLDLISNGEILWKQVLKEFWYPFIDNINEVKQLKITDILQSIREYIESYIFSKNDTGEINRDCPSCSNGKLDLQVGRTGIFLGCSNYPECKYTKNISEDSSESDDRINGEYPKILGIDPASGKEVLLKKGPYGFYLQIDDDKQGKKSSVPNGVDVDSLELEQAINLLSLPKVLGIHPESGQNVTLGIGKYGPYILYNSKYFSVKNKPNFLNISLDEAINIINSAATPSGVIRSLGQSSSGEEILICKGRYGFYLKHGNTNVALGKKNIDIDSITLHQAEELIQEKK